jgi:serine/threonine protein kinase
MRARRSDQLKATLPVDADAGPAGAPATGELLHDRYRLLRPIGAGAMGVVWLARDELLRRRVAVKVLREGSDDPANDQGSDGNTVGSRAGVLRHLREARTAAALSHPNVTSVFDVGEQDGHAFIVMELVDGSTLQDLLARGPLSEADAARIGAALAGALAAAHRAGVMHLDVKPANVIVSGAGEVKLTDLGIASDVPAPASVPKDERVSKARTAVYGTLPYVAPERLRGGPAGPPSDVYAVGVVLHEMVAGRLPFDAASADELRRAQEVGAPALQAADPSIVEACRSALAFEPDDRPSAAALAAMLGGGVVETPTEVVPPVPPPTSAQAPAPSAPAGEPSRTSVLLPAAASEASTAAIAPTPSPRRAGRARRALVALALAGASIAAAVGLIGVLNGAGGAPANAPSSPPAVVVPSPTGASTPTKAPAGGGHHGGNGHHHHHGHGKD